MNARAGVHEVPRELGGRHRDIQACCEWTTITNRTRTRSLGVSPQPTSHSHFDLMSQSYMYHRDQSADYNDGRDGSGPKLRWQGV